MSTFGGGMTNGSSEADEIDGATANQVNAAAPAIAATKDARLYEVLLMANFPSKLSLESS